MSDVLGNFIFWTIVTSPIWGSILAALILAWAWWGDDE